MSFTLICNSYWQDRHIHAVLKSAIERGTCIQSSVQPRKRLRLDNFMRN